MAVRERAYLGEPVLLFDRWWNRLPLAARPPFAWVQPLCERAFLREPDEIREDPGHRRRAHTCQARRGLQWQLTR